MPARHRAGTFLHADHEGELHVGPVQAIAGADEAAGLGGVGGQHAAAADREAQRCQRHAARGAPAQRIRLGTRVVHRDRHRRVVLQVLPHAGQGVRDGDAVALQFIGRADARQLQQLRRLDRAGGQQHLGRFGRHLQALPIGQAQQLAGHGEIASARAVAADDPRLIEADEARKGRVQFARKGESADLKAVQASDPRLQSASEENKGVVQFARDGIAASGQAVQSTDSRLVNAREPKAHTHSEYAKHEHELNSHTGNLHLRRAAKTVAADAVTPSFDINLPLLVENTQGLAASFTGGVVLSADGTASYHVSKTAPAIQASSRDQSAATLISANAYALHLPKSLPGLKGSEKSMHAEGHVQIDGSMNLKGGASVTVALPRASNEAFVDGDLVAIENGVAAKMRNDSQTCVGIVVKSGGIQLESGAVAVRVAVAGVVSLRAYGIVKAGDRLVLNSGQPGTCKPGQGSEKTIAIALEAANSDREKQVLGILVR